MSEITFEVKAGILKPVLHINGTTIRLTIPLEMPEAVRPRLEALANQARKLTPIARAVRGRVSEDQNGVLRATMFSSRSRAVAKVSEHGVTPYDEFKRWKR